MDPLLAFTVVAFTLFGLVFGSFANVVIWRLPRGESFVSPPSHCPACGTRIRWYDNVPLISWLVLGGRCRDCGEPISQRYFLVEAASGVLFALAALRFGPTLRAVLAAALFWFLLVLSAIDVDHYRLPNALVGSLAVLGLGGVLVTQFVALPLAPLVGPSGGASLLSQPLVLALIGVALGAGISGAIAAAYSAIRHKRGLGMGDIKLLGTLGLFLGPYVLIALFLGSIFGAAAGLVSLRETELRDRRIPFGPWLAGAAAITVLVGPMLLAWYLTVTGII